MTLTIFLVECGLELIPKRIRSHPAVKRNLSMNNYYSQLLDNALHHSAMRRLKNHNKRGRPDIVHLCLLNALGSPLNKSGQLRIFVHTVKNRLFEFNPKIRITKNFNRFKGLMAKLLIDDGIKTEKEFLIAHVSKSLNEKLSEFEDKEKIILSEQGKQIKSFKHLYERGISKDYALIIGGFQKAAFSNNILDLSDNLISIAKESLFAWIIVSRVITFYEIMFNII
ncbi:MAG: 16S rRNA methyltransferase [Promethearchaeati archaeon]